MSDMSKCEENLIPPDILEEAHTKQSVLGGRVGARRRRRGPPRPPRGPPRSRHVLSLARVAHWLATG
ncbi:hypothetical protein MSG28_013065 [Choristoneura fumiferana]|uniref:Uncharacterized protein n=1 Tax=Choristoneura fumiferana TaxID=7141 RepID=A0ACC0KSC2_CHOFU|nr:hypothetical protein MSG28_013065 [Choristoneura fumiferana]